MCGIFIWVNKNGQGDASKAAKALTLQNHRGPDSQSIFFWDGVSDARIEDVPEGLNRGSFEGRNFKLAIGNNRLAINDPSPRANQPMLGPDGKSIISFNGCIYNFVEIRKELEEKGEFFHTTGDTEILLRSLMLKGTDAIRVLNGAWAFAFFDPSNEDILISRDRYGERPLFYYYDDENFIAASEIKAIYAVLSEKNRMLRVDHTMAFLIYRKWPEKDGGKTIYKDIQKLLPGTTMRFNLPRHRFDISEENTITHFIGSNPDPEKISNDLSKSVSMRLRADVPIGVLLSGGVDSTFIAALVASQNNVSGKTTFFSADFPDNISPDTLWAEKAANDLGVDLIKVPLIFDEQAIGHLKNLTHQYEMPVPFAGTTITMSSLYKEMSRQGIKVVLDGTGGDEIFGGYRDRYIMAAIWDLIKKGRIPSSINLARTAFDRNWIDQRMFLKSVFERILKQKFKASPWRHFKSFIKPELREVSKRSPEFFLFGKHYGMTLKEIQIDDINNGMLQSYASYADNNSMMNSIENRSPFLDSNLAKYINLPVQEKYTGVYNKYSLRKAMPDSIGRDIAFRKEKIGARWVTGLFFKKNKDHIRETLLNTQILHEMFYMEPFLKLINDSPRFEFILHNMFSLALLSNEYNCEIDI